MTTLFYVKKDGARGKIEVITFSYLDTSLQYIDANTNKALIITDVISIFIW